MLRIVIAGRPNVGKSTLFNRLAQKKLAIIHDTPGVTRDWRETPGAFFGYPVMIVDTAGLEKPGDTLPGRMRAGSEEAMKAADVILFMIDGRAGVTPEDAHLAREIRRLNKPVILLVNKCESEASYAEGMADSYQLGLGDPVIISAAHGHGMDSLFDHLQPYLEAAEKAALEDEAPPDGQDWLTEAEIDALEGVADHDDDSAPEETQPDLTPIRIAIAGRPNAGKSTLVNALIGEERMLTGPEAGITRDAVAVDWAHGGRIFRLVDTAGLRRKARIHETLEKLSVDETLRAIRLARVVVLVIDAQLGVEKQDLTILRHVLDEGRAVVIAVNKWDAVKDKNEARAQISDAVDHLAQIKNLPLIYISALSGRNLDALMDAVGEVHGRWSGRVSTGKLNRWLGGVAERNPPPMTEGRPNKMRFISQIKTRPPTFALWVSRPKDLPESYRRYLLNQIRSAYDFDGIPLRLLVRTSKNPYVS